MYAPRKATLHGECVALRLDVAGADPREEGGGGARRVGARSRESALNRPDMPGGLNEARRHRFNRLDENEKEIVA